MESVEVTIDGAQYMVPKRVADEIEHLKINLGDTLYLFIPEANDTIIVTLPDDAGRDLTESVLQVTAKQFPEARVCVLPESLGLHQQANFAELVEAGTDMADAILGREMDLSKRTEAAKAWDRLVGRDGG